tara:strand:- start:400 stop:948 length:549 start_codon:yes stop_codon:yes gene_type:complete
MIFPNTFVKKVIASIIAPHGVTDLVHAKQNKLLPQLYTINICSVLGSMGLNNNAHTFADILFYSISIYHFRNDMPELKDIANKTTLSALMIMSFFAIDPNLFLYYMVFIHVPNHYLMNWSTLKKNTIFSILLLSITTLVSMIIANDPSIVESELVENISKGLIFSHIIYEESYIFKTIPLKN